MWKETSGLFYQRKQKKSFRVIIDSNEDHQHIMQVSVEDYFFVLLILYEQDVREAFNPLISIDDFLFFVYIFHVILILL